MIESLEVRSTGRLPGYPYEWVSAVAHYAVDPDAPANARIADLGLAPRGGDGLVRFAGDVVLLRPDGGGSRRALLAVPNRGMVRLPFCGAGALPGGVAAPPSTGDGFLLSRGWTVALVGWQWDVPRADGFAGLDVPAADPGPGWLRSDFRVDAPARERPLADVLARPGLPPIAFTAYPASSLTDPAAALRVRSRNWARSPRSPGRGGSSPRRRRSRWTAASSRSGGTSWSTARPTRRWPARGCLPCGTSARTCAARPTTSSPPGSRRRAGCCASCCSRASTSTSGASRCSTACWRTSRAHAGASSTAATRSPACWPR